ncbi:MAG: NDP-sugar synthase [archaeon]|nr:MAG: NDP-sugar synthase [archaeon]
MEAIILAGGFGTRLKPLTYTRAKSLLPIMNRPMISYIVNQLPDEVNRVILAVNYRKKEIEEFFEGNDFGKEIIVNEEKTPLGTGGAAKFAEKHITGSFFVLNSDIISSLDMKKMVDFHYKNNGFITISLWPVKNVSEFGVVDIEGDRIKKFVEKPRPEEAPSNLINAGAYFMEPEVMDRIESGRLVSMEKEIFPKVIGEGKSFLGYRVSGYWIDVGRIKSYLRVHRILMEKTGKENFVGENCKIQGKVSGSCLGDGVFVGEGTEVRDSILYDRVHVSEMAKMKNCVIGEDCEIGRDSDLENVVIGDNEVIEDGSMIRDKKIWTQKIPEGYPEEQVGNVLKR